MRAGELGEADSGELALGRWRRRRERTRRAAALTAARTVGRQRLVLGLVVMFLGGAGLVYEYCLSTLATHLIGNSVEQFSVIIALMLFAMGIAGAMQRRIGVGDASGETIAGAFVVVEIGLALIGGASALALYAAFAWLEHFRLVLYGLAIVIGFGIGLEIPLLLRLNEEERPELKDNVGEILALDYVGALAGALLWAFVLLPWLALDRISLLLGLANLGAAAVTLWVLRNRLGDARRVAALGASIVGAGACLVTLWIQGPRLIETARQHLYADPIRHHATSRFQDIVVTGVGQRMSLYLNGRLQLDSEDEHIYHELLVHPAMHALGRPAARVLVLGGGDGLAVREILRWPSVREVLVVDLDPAVTELARTYPPLVSLNDGALADSRVRTVAGAAAGVSPGPTTEVRQAAQRPRLGLRGHSQRVAEVSLLHVDADAFLRRALRVGGAPSDGRWDAVIIDFPDPSTPDLAKLYSLEFYKQLAPHLAPDAVVALQAGSPYANRRAFWAIADTLQAAGFAPPTALHAHVPTFGEWGWHLTRLATAGQAQPIDPVGPLPAGARYATPAAIEAALSFPAPFARPDASAQVSTRLDPVVMRLYLEGETLEGPTLYPGVAER